MTGKTVHNNLFGEPTVSLLPEGNNRRSQEARALEISAGSKTVARPKGTRSGTRETFRRRRNAYTSSSEHLRHVPEHEV